MKKTILLGTAALAIFGLFAMRRNKKVKNRVLAAAAEGLLTNSALKLLHSAKRAAIKEIQTKR